MFHGSMVAVVTPMAADGALDFEALARLVEFHIENGTDAIISVGTTGESATVDFEEHIEVVRRVVELVRSRVPVIAGTGAVNTRSAVDPILTFADVRALRETVWRAFVNRGDNGDGNDTNASIEKIVKLRGSSAAGAGASGAAWGGVSWAGAAVARMTAKAAVRYARRMESPQGRREA